MGFFSKSIFDAAVEGGEEFVKNYINKNKNLDVFDNCNTTPLYGACSMGHYRIAILLLEAGATPHCHPKDALCVTPIHLMVTYVKIRIMKLLIWFDPNYENVLEPLNKTVAERIAVWPQPAKTLLKNTALDANTVIAIRKTAELLEEKGVYLEAALKYATIAEIFCRHSQLEKEYKFELADFVKYAWHYSIEEAKEDDKKAQQIFIEYYLVQAEKYLSKFIECINQAPQTTEKNEALTKYRSVYQTVLNELIEICKSDFIRKTVYLNKLAHLLIDQPDSTSENTSSDESDEVLLLASSSFKKNETKPLLAAMNTHGLRKRRVLPIQEATSDNAHQTKLQI